MRTRWGGGLAPRVPWGAGALMWTRGLLVALGLLGVAGLVAAPVAAEPIARLDTQVTDTAGALAGSETEVAVALDELQSDAAIQLWVAYVATFDGLGGQQWAQGTAEASGFGGNDVLFAVAVEDGAYGYSVDDAFPLGDDELADIMAGSVEPELVDGDWAGAVITLADSLGSARESEGASGTGGAVGSGGPSAWLWLLAGVVLVGGVLLLVGLFRARSARERGPNAGGAGAAAAPQEIPLADLRQEVAAALIEADDSIKTSEQELGFAIAQFGDEAAAPFTAALAESREELQQAFRLQRQAQEAAAGPPASPAPGSPGDAAGPGAPASERSLLEQILALCLSADDRLDAQVDAFDALRDLERTIDAILPGVDDRVAALESRFPASRATAEGLASRFPPAAVATLAQNVDQAAERIAFARTCVTTASELLASGDRNAAVTQVRAAEEAIGQADALLDGVDAAPQVLDLAERSISALMAETEKDLAEAESLGVSGVGGSGGAGDSGLAAVHHYASETLTWARSVVASGNYDPIATRRALEDSDNALERALAPARQAAATRARAQALLGTSTEAAHIAIRTTDSYITTRRAAVGAEARTRLAEARRRLAEGLAEDDPVVALAHVQAADHLADQAHALAQQDEARYRDAQQRGGGPTSGVGTMILGGILLDGLARGSGRGWGGPAGRPRGGSRRPPGGSRGPGSFGGGGTRGRRSGGGRF